MKDYKYIWINIHNPNQTTYTKDNNHRMKTIKLLDTKWELNQIASDFIINQDDKLERILVLGSHHVIAFSVSEEVRPTCASKLGKNAHFETDRQRFLAHLKRGGAASMSAPRKEALVMKPAQSVLSAAQRLFEYRTHYGGARWPSAASTSQTLEQRSGNVRCEP